MSFINGINGGSRSFISAVYVRTANNHVDIGLHVVHVGIEIVAAVGSFDVGLDSCGSIGGGSHIIAVHTACKVVNGVVHVLLRHTEDIGFASFGNNCRQFTFNGGNVVGIFFAAFALTVNEVVFVCRGKFGIGRFAAFTATYFAAVYRKGHETYLTSRTSKREAILRCREYDGDRRIFNGEVRASRKSLRKVINVRIIAIVFIRNNNELRHTRELDDYFGVLIETSGICIICNVRRATSFIVGKFYAVLFPNLLFSRLARTVSDVSKAKLVAVCVGGRINNVTAAFTAAFADNVFHKPSVLELCRTVILRKYAVYFNEIAFNGLGFHLVVTNGTVFAVKTVNENFVVFSVFNVNVAVRRAIRIETSNRTAYVVLLRGFRNKVLTDFQCLRNRKGRTVCRKCGSDANRNVLRFRNVATGNGCFKNNFRSVGNVRKRHLAAFDGDEFAIACPRNQYFGIHSATFGKFYFRIALIGVLQAKGLNGICNLIRCGNRRSINKTYKVTNVVAIFTIMLRSNGAADGFQRAVVTKIEFNVFVAVSIFVKHRDNRFIRIAPIEFGYGACSIKYNIVMAAVSTYAHTDIVLNVFLRFAGCSVNNVFLEVKVEVRFAAFNVFCIEVDSFRRFSRRFEIVAVHCTSKVHILLQRGLIQVELVRRIFQRFTRNRSRYVLTYCFYGESEVLRIGFAVRCRNRSRKNVVYVNRGSFVYVYFRNVAVAFQFNAVYVNTPSKGVVGALYVGDYVRNFEVNVVVGIYVLIVHTLQNSFNSLKVDYPAFARYFTCNAIARGAIFVCCIVFKTAAHKSKTREHCKNADELFLHEFLLIIFI